MQCADLWRSFKSFPVLAKDESVLCDEGKYIWHLWKIAHTFGGEPRLALKLAAGGSAEKFAQNFNGQASLFRAECTALASKDLQGTSLLEFTTDHSHQVIATRPTCDEDKPLGACRRIGSTNLQQVENVPWSLRISLWLSEAVLRRGRLEPFFLQGCWKVQIALT